jgi:hypothetical protein
MVGVVIVAERPWVKWVRQDGREGELPHYLFFVGKKKASLLVLNNLEGILAGMGEGISCITVVFQEHLEIGS